MSASIPLKVMFSALQTTETISPFGPKIAFEMSQKPYAMQEIGQILKSNGYDKVSTKLAPTFLLKFMANFNSEMKGMLPFIGNTIEADVSNTLAVFNWKPISFEKTVLDTAKSVETALKK